MKHCVAPLLLALMAVSLLWQEARAIPAFARKYKTSCATCHTGFPKLNAFGEAFRRNGYMFPAHTDAQYTKEDPVSLGAEGNKRAFPDAIWPATIPGTSPVAFFLNGEMVYNPKDEPRFSFDGLGSSLEAVVAGTLDDDISFWAGAALSSEGLELHRVFMVFSNLVGDSYGLNARIGAFEPGLFSFSVHRSWLEGYWITTRPFSEDMGFSFEEYQKGIELNGMCSGRFGWNAAILEGYGNPHSAKDFYGHVTYKFGGMPLDGVVEGGPSMGGTQPFIDNSITVGAYGYLGNSSIGPSSAPQADKFTQFGLDYNLYYERFNLFGAIGLRHDDQPFVGVPGTTANTTVWFSELDYVVYPWLLPLLRFESWNSHMYDATAMDTPSYTDLHIVPGIQFLIRPNLRVVFQASFLKLGSEDSSKLKADQLSLFASLGI